MECSSRARRSLVAAIVARRCDSPTEASGLFLCSRAITETGAATSLTGPIQAGYAIGDDFDLLRHVRPR